MKQKGILAVCALALSIGSLCRGQDVLTEHNDNWRTGANDSETLLNASNVNAQRFGKVWNLYSDGQIVAQPLYVSHLKTPKCPEGCNAVIFCSMHNTVYAYDADRKPQTQIDTLLWSRSLGKTRPSNAAIDMFHTNDPEWGILGTPVVDRDRGVLYVVSWNDAGGERYPYFLRALDLATGSDRIPPREIAGSVEASAGKSKPTGIDFRPEVQKQRAGLLLDHGILYIAFGAADEFHRGYHGWVFAYDATTFERKAVWCSTPAGAKGGIWQSGQGPAADATGNIYVTTGDGTFDAGDSGPDYGDSLVKLRLESDHLAIQDYFTPCNQAQLARNDLDLGSAGPAFVAGTRFVLGAGKQGRLYVLDSLSMGHYTASSNPKTLYCANPSVLDEVQASSGGHLMGSPVSWKGPDAPRVYVWPEMDALKSYVIHNGKLQAPPAKSSYVIGCHRPEEMCIPGGMLSVSSDGAKAGTGIVWAIVPVNGNVRRRGVPGMLLALDAPDVSKELWRSDRADHRDDLGMFAKFCPPTVAGGKVFVATYGDRAGDPKQNYRDIHYSLAVYGLIQ